MTTYTTQWCCPTIQNRMQNTMFCEANACSSISCRPKIIKDRGTDRQTDGHNNTPSFLCLGIQMTQSAFQKSLVLFCFFILVTTFHFDNCFYLQSGVFFARHNNMSKLKLIHLKLIHLLHSLSCNLCPAFIFCLRFSAPHFLFILSPCATMYFSCSAFTDTKLAIICLLFEGFFSSFPTFSRFKGLLRKINFFMCPYYLFDILSLNCLTKLSVNHISLLKKLGFGPNAAFLT